MYYHKEFEVVNNQTFQKYLLLLEQMKEKIKVKDQDQ